MIFRGQGHALVDLQGRQRLRGAQECDRLVQGGQAFNGHLDCSAGASYLVAAIKFLRLFKVRSVDLRLRAREIDLGDDLALKRREEFEFWNGDIGGYAAADLCRRADAALLLLGQY